MTGRVLLRVWQLCWCVSLVLVQQCCSRPLSVPRDEADRECLPYERRSQDEAIALPSNTSKYTNLKYIPEERLVFCLIPKVASSSFLRLFSRMAGVPLRDRKAKKKLRVSDPNNMEALRQGRYQVLPSFDSLVSDDYSTAVDALNSQKWTRVAVFRDPAERLLSAYLDKIQATTAFSRHKLLIFADIMNLTLPVNATVEDIKESLQKITFPEFVDLVIQQGEAGLWNPHWRHQSEFCGLKQIFHKLDMVMVLNYGGDTSTTQFARCLFQKLLRKRMLDKDFTEKKYTSLHKYSRGADGTFKYKPRVNVLEYFEQIKAELSSKYQESGKTHANAGYISNARKHMKKMYDSHLIGKVKRLYQQDYIVLQLPTE